MTKRACAAECRAVALAVVLSAAWQDGRTTEAHPIQAWPPVEQYLMGDRNAEMALARSAAPRR